MMTADDAPADDMEPDGTVRECGGRGRCEDEVARVLRLRDACADFGAQSPRRPP